MLAKINEEKLTEKEKEMIRDLQNTGAIEIEETDWKQMCQDVYTEWKKAVFFEGALCIGLLIIVAIISVHIL